MMPRRPPPALHRLRHATDLLRYIQLYVDASAGLPLIRCEEKRHYKSHIRRAAAAADTLIRDTRSLLPRYVLMFAATTRRYERH